MQVEVGRDILSVTKKDEAARASISRNKRKRGK
jgi:hypothetical protein